MHALKDLFTTDVGLMNISGISFMLGMDVFFIRYPALHEGRHRQGSGCITASSILSLAKEPPMPLATDTYCALTQAVSTELASRRTSTPDVMRAFGDLGRAVIADGVLDKKTKELIALPLSVAVRCDPCVGFHTQALAKLGATRQEVDETLGVAVYMGGGPSFMYTASAIEAFDEFSGTPKV